MKKGFVIFSSLLMGVYLLAQTKPVPKKPVQTKTGSSKSAGTATTGLKTFILKGLNDPIEIQDDEFHNPMPPQPQLTDQEIADVLTYVRNSFGNKASAVTPAEVKTVRGRLK